MQGLRERNKGRRRLAILAAAHRLITRDGLDGLTMRAIAAEAGLSVPTVYHLVGGRDEVIDALLARGADRFDAALEDTLEDASADPYRHALAAVEVLADLVCENRAVVRAVLSSGRALGTGGTDPLFVQVRAAIEDALARARSVQTLRRGTDASVLAARVEMLNAGAVIAWTLVHGDDDRLRADLAHGVTLVFAAAASESDRVRFERELRRCERVLRARPRSQPRGPRSRTARRAG